MMKPSLLRPITKYLGVIFEERSEIIGVEQKQSRQAPPCWSTSKKERSLKITSCFILIIFFFHHQQHCHRHRLSRKLYASNSIAKNVKKRKDKSESRN